MMAHHDEQYFSSMLSCSTINLSINSRCPLLLVFWLASNETETAGLLYARALVLLQAQRRFHKARRAGLPQALSGRSWRSSTIKAVPEAEAAL